VYWENIFQYLNHKYEVHAMRKKQEQEFRNEIIQIAVFLAIFFLFLFFINKKTKSKRHNILFSICSRKQSQAVFWSRNFESEKINAYSI
jgi:hypothetical protein